MHRPPYPPKKSRSRFPYPSTYPLTPPTRAHRDIPDNPPLSPPSGPIASPLASPLGTPPNPKSSPSVRHWGAVRTSVHLAASSSEFPSLQEARLKWGHERPSSETSRTAEQELPRTQPTPGPAAPLTLAPEHLSEESANAASVERQHATGTSGRTIPCVTPAPIVVQASVLPSMAPLAPLLAANRPAPTLPRSPARSPAPVPPVDLPSATRGPAHVPEASEAPHMPPLPTTPALVLAAALECARPPPALSGSASSGYAPEPDLVPAPVAEDHAGNGGEALQESCSPEREEAAEDHGGHSTHAGDAIARRDADEADHATSRLEERATQEEVAGGGDKGEQGSEAQGGDEQAEGGAREEAGDAGAAEGEGEKRGSEEEGDSEDNSEGDGNGDDDDAEEEGGGEEEQGEEEEEEEDNGKEGSEATPGEEAAEEEEEAGGEEGSKKEGSEEDEEGEEEGEGQKGGEAKTNGGGEGNADEDLRKADLGNGRNISDTAEPLQHCAPPTLGGEVVNPEKPDTEEEGGEKAAEAAEEREEPSGGEDEEGSGEEQEEKGGEEAEAEGVEERERGGADNADARKVGDGEAKDGAEAEAEVKANEGRKLDSSGDEEGEDAGTEETGRAAGEAQENADLVGSLRSLELLLPPAAAVAVPTATQDAPECADYSLADSAQLADTPPSPRRPCSPAAADMLVSTTAYSLAPPRTSGASGRPSNAEQLTRRAPPAVLPSEPLRQSGAPLRTSPSPHGTFAGSRGCVVIGPICIKYAAVCSIS